MFKFSILFVALVSSFSGQVRAQSLMEAFMGSDIVFYGEFHKIEQHLDPVFETLEEGLKAGKINTLATEYVQASLDKHFQDYLNSKTAVKNSDEENFFFYLILEKSNFASSPRNRDYYRKLRDLKLKYKDNFRICSIDFLVTEEEENSQSFRHSAYSSIPTILREVIEDITGKTIEEVSKTRDLYYREAHMAKNIASCFNSSKHKGLVHIGIGHITSTDFLVSGDWWAVTKYFSEIVDRKITVVGNMIPNQDSKVQKQIAIDLAFASPRLLFRDELTNAIKNIMNKSSNGQIDQTMIFDAYIFGPVSDNVQEDIIWQKGEKLLYSD